MLTAYDGQSISYDGSGNPTRYYNGTRWTFTWKNGRELATASAGSTSISYAYDLGGLRTKKTVGTTAHNYIYASGKLLRETYGSNTLDFFYDNNGTPFALKHNGTLYYYVTNLQGDVMNLVDGSGNVVATYDYDPYGKVITSTGSMAETNPLRYRGYYYDTESGLYYLQSRYYDPAIGRFINADSYSSTGQGILGHNMFAYCGNNPISNVDVSGEFFNTICGTIVGGLISAFTRDKNKETFEEAFQRGAVTGFIAGAALDVSIATAGTGAAVVIAVSGGAVAAALDYGWEQKNKNEEATFSGYVTNAIIGGGLNALFMGAGRELANTVGKTAKTVATAIWDNTVKSVTNRAGKVVAKKLLNEGLKNFASSTLQAGAGKTFSLVFSKMIEAFYE